MKLTWIIAAALCASSVSALAATRGRPSPGEQTIVQVNSVCKAKAEALVKAAHLVDWPEDASTTGFEADTEGVRSEKRNSVYWTYRVFLTNTGGKGDMGYLVQVEESGPNACYLKGIAPIQN